MKHIVVMVLSLYIACGSAGMALAHGTAQLSDHFRIAGLTPDNPFYFLDRFFEGFAGIFKFNAKARARYQAELALERLAEAKAVAEVKGEAGAEAVKEAIDEYQEHIEKVAAIVKEQQERGQDVSDILQELNEVADLAAEFIEEAEFEIGEEFDELEEVQALLEDLGLPEEFEEESELEAAKPTPEVQSFFDVFIEFAPSSVVAGESFKASWAVKASRTTVIKHTAIHYGYKSNPVKFGTDVGPDRAGYPFFTPAYYQGEFKIPQTFTDALKAPEAGMIYMRAHAIIDGKHYWSGERALKVAPGAAPAPVTKEPVPPPTTAPAPTGSTKNFVIVADDGNCNGCVGFSPRQVTARKGDTVVITFNVIEGRVYFGGLDIRGGAYFNTGSVKPGGSATVKFVAEQSFEFSSWWPASNVLKTTGKVIVE